MLALLSATKSAVALPLLLAALYALIVSGVKNLSLKSHLKSLLTIASTVLFICIGFCCPMLCRVLRWLTATGRLSVKLNCCFLLCPTVFIRLLSVVRAGDWGI